MLDLRRPQQVNFATIDKDYEKILERFFNNQKLLKLLYYNTPDCLEKDNITDTEILQDISKNNIRIIPRIEIPEKKNSFIIIQFDDFTPNQTNPQFIDNGIYIDILCPNESSILMLDTYMLRPYRIMHEINSDLDKTKLNGIGRIDFQYAEAINIDGYYGYRMSYLVVNNV